MIGKLAPLILLSTMPLIQTAAVPYLISLTVAELGDNVTLTCPVSATEGGFFNLLKQPLGHMVQEVAAGVLGKIIVSDTRFTVTKGNDQYLLSIRNVSKDDEATYFCQNGTAYKQTFLNGTFLAVNDWNQQKHVKQSPKTASVQLGDTVPLQCSLLFQNKENGVQCPREHSVYWFRAGSRGFHPGIIYTHSSRSDEEEERSCVYSLSKTIQSSSDTGIYYCAVVTCGKILFGGGTKVETGSGLNPVVLVLGGLLACCVTVIVVLIFCANQRVCKHCKGAGSASHYSRHDESTVDQSNNVDGETLTYVAVSFSTKKAKRLRSELPQECTYSATKYKDSHM